MFLIDEGLLIIFTLSFKISKIYDQEKSFEKNVQNITDNHISIVDEKVSTKEKEIMTI